MSFFCISTFESHGNESHGKRITTPSPSALSVTHTHTHTHTTQALTSPHPTTRMQHPMTGQETPHNDARTQTGTLLPSQTTPVYNRGAPRARTPGTTPAGRVRATGTGCIARRPSGTCGTACCGLHSVKACCSLAQCEWWWVCMGREGGNRLLAQIRMTETKSTAQPHALFKT